MSRPSPMKLSKKTNFTSSRGISLCWILSYLFNSQLNVVLTCKLLEGQRALTQRETCSCRAAFYDLRLLQAQLLQLSTANGAGRNWQELTGTDFTTFDSFWNSPGLSRKIYASLHQSSGAWLTHCLSPKALADCEFSVTWAAYCATVRQEHGGLTEFCLLSGCSDMFFY